MANYTIIGGDGKEYSLVSGEDLRKWIAEGRLNAQSLAKAEGEAQFRPLSAFPEFAEVLGAAPAAAPAAPPAGDGREAALQAVKGPAISLIVVASLGIVLCLARAVMCLAFGGAMMLQNQMGANVPPQVQQWMALIQGPVGAAIYLVLALVNAFVLFGAIKMLRLQSHGLVLTALIVAMLPCATCCCLLGLPFGIWALVVISKPEIKSQFS